MPLTDLQLRILRVVSANRSPDNYVAGGSALNTIDGRYSQEIDIFSDSVEQSSQAVRTDAKPPSLPTPPATWINHSSESRPQCILGHDPSPSKGQRGTFGAGQYHEP